MDGSSRARIDDDDSEVTTATPRKRARMPGAGVTVLQERKKGSPAFLRPFIQDRGLLDMWFTDARGRRAPDNCMAYFDCRDKLSSDIIARAILYYDTNEIQRVRTFNQMLRVFMIRRYIHKLVTSQDMGNETSYKYSKPDLLGASLELADALPSVKP